MRPLIACCLAILAATPAAASPPPVAQIVTRCQHAYDSVKTLDLTARGTIGGTAATAHIRFSRPNLRITGNSMFGRSYDLISDGKTAWVNIAGSWMQQRSPEMGIAAITGIAANAGTVVPALLIRASFNPLVFNGTVKVGEATLAGHRAYRITASQPFPTTCWIDESSYMILRLQRQVMGRTLDVTMGPAKTNQPIPASAFRK